MLRLHLIIIIIISHITIHAHKKFLSSGINISYKFLG